MGYNCLFYSLNWSGNRNQFLDTCNVKKEKQVLSLGNVQSVEKTGVEHLQKQVLSLGNVQSVEKTGVEHLQKQVLSLSNVQSIEKTGVEHLQRHSEFLRVSSLRSYGI